MIIAVDFDDTLFAYDHRARAIGLPNLELIEAMKLARTSGHKVILWTCREGKALGEAVAACRNHGLTFDAVNENVQTEVSSQWPDSRKVYADSYIDDRAVRCDWVRTLYRCSKGLDSSEQLDGLCIEAPI